MLSVRFGAWRVILEGFQKRSFNVAIVLMDLGSRRWRDEFVRFKATVIGVGSHEIIVESDRTTLFVTHDEWFCSESKNIQTQKHTP